MIPAASNSLGHRLAIMVTAALLLLTAVTGSASFFVDYRMQLSQAMVRQQQLVRTIQTQAEVAVFAQNLEIAGDVLDGLLTNETIAAAGLISAGGFEQRKIRDGAVTKLSTNAVTTYPLRSPVDRQSPIGELLITADEDAVRDEAIRSAARTSIINILQVFLTASILALVFRRVVGTPIATLAQTLSRIRVGGDDRVLVDTRHLDDEIGVLSTSANRLLDSAQHALEHERELRTQVEAMEQHYRRIFETTNVGIMVLTADGRLTNSNPVLMQKIVGVHFDVCYTPDSADFLSAIFVQPKQAWAMVNEASAVGRAVAADLQLKTVQGPPRWAHCIISVTHDRRGRIEMIEGVLYDVTNRRTQEDEARKRAEMDALTGLKNRHGSDLFIDKAVRHAADDKVRVGLMLIDLDGFKAVNDTLGHAAGDEVLVEVALRLRLIIRRSADAVGRLGGDEFMVVTYNCGDSDDMLGKIAGEIIAALSAPVELANSKTAHIGASIGIARYPDNGVTRTMLFEEADRAMYQVKRSGKNGFAFAARIETTVATPSVPDLSGPAEV